MYNWLCSRLPRPLVNLGYGLWYACLLVLILYLADRPVVDFYYLRG